MKNVRGSLVVMREDCADYYAACFDALQKDLPKVFLDTTGLIFYASQVKHSREDIEIEQHVSTDGFGEYPDDYFESTENRTDFIHGCVDVFTDCACYILDKIEKGILGEEPTAD